MRYVRCGAYGGTLTNGTRTTTAESAAQTGGRSRPLARSRMWAGPTPATARMSTRKPYNDRAGYVASRRSGANRGYVVIYRAAEQGLDPRDGGPWAVICESHGIILRMASLRAARSAMKGGSIEFCDDCRAITEDGT